MSVPREFCLWCKFKKNNENQVLIELIVRIRSIDRSLHTSFRGEKERMRYVGYTTYQFTNSNLTVTIIIIMVIIIV